MQTYAPRENQPRRLWSELSPSPGLARAGAESMPALQMGTEAPSCGPVLLGGHSAAPLVTLTGSGGPWPERALRGL